MHSPALSPESDTGVKGPVDITASMGWSREVDLSTMELHSTWDSTYGLSQASEYRFELLL